LPIIIKEEGSRPIKAWVGTKPTTDYEKFVCQMGETKPDIEDSALQQVKNLARLPFIASNGVALMPDVHAGIGSTVGSVIATDKAVIPAAVGVDIGCGMNAVRLSLKADQLPDNLKAIFDQIMRDVPTGMNGHQESSRQYIENINLLPRPTQLAKKALSAVGARKSSTNEGTDFVTSWGKAASQLGSLGGGNHFIELCIDENQDVWVMLHSGSRGIGNQIGTHFIERAKRNMEKFFVQLPDADLAYFPEDTDDFNEYVEAVNWAQEFAFANRARMMDFVLAALKRHIPIEFTITQEAINCHHNYVVKENHFGRNLWVTRKGAIRAREGDLGIIPGSMGDRSYIVRGKGNLESYCSCSHGAGRIMSRTEAKKRFSLTDLIAQTEGVMIKQDAGLVDEIPGAYKRIDEVMENQKDLVEVVHTLKQVLNVKGVEVKKKWKDRK
jgi:tRNA-splicing ligase RtcB